MSKEVDIGSAVEIAEELHASRKFLKSVFDRIPGMIYVHDLVNDVNLYRSWTLKRILGYEESDVLNSGEGIRSLLHQDDVAEFRRAVKRIQHVKDNESIRFTYRMRHQDGSWVWFRSEEYVYDRDTSGRPTKILGYATDLTSTVKDRERLNELNRVNELLLNAAYILSQPDKEPRATLNELARELSHHFQVVCDISILDTESDLIRPHALYHPDEEVRKLIANLFDTVEVKRGQGLVGRVIETGEELLIKEVPEEMQKGPANVDNRIIPISIMYVPIKGGDAVLGSLNLTRLKGQREFTEAESEQIRRLGEYLSLFVENALLKEEQQYVSEIRLQAERQLAEEKKWVEFKLAASSILADVESDIFTGLQKLCVIVAEHFDVVCDVQLVDEARGKIEIVTIHHQDMEVKKAIESSLKTHELTIGEGMVGGVVESGKEFYVYQLPDHLREKAEKEGTDPRIIPCSFAYLPLKSHGKILGTLDLTRLSHQSPISDKELVQMRDLADHAARFIENRMLQASQKKEIELRKKAEKKLERSSKLLSRMEAETRAMLNAIPIYISRISKDLRFLFLNDFYQNMGMNPRKLEGRFTADVVGEEGVKKLMPHYKKVLSGELVNYEYDGVMADGRHHYFSVALAPDLAENGEVIGFYSCATDITSKVLAEQAAKLTQDRLNTLSLNSGDAFFFHDEDQNILDVNEVACDMLGYTREEFLSMKAADIDPRWYGREYQKYLSQIGTNEPQTFETSIFTKRGTEVPVEVRFVKRLENNRAYIQSLIRDRTEKREQERKLQQSEERLRLIFENVEDHIAMVSADGIIESINKVWNGLAPEDVVGTSIYEPYDEPEKIQNLKARFEQLKQTGQAFEVEDSSVGPQGVISHHIRKFIAIFHDNTFFKCVLMVRDVTAERDRKRSEMNAVLKGQEQERKRLGAELHDGIGQVLSAIALQVSRIKEEADKDGLGALNDEITELKDNLLGAIKEVRNISHDLMPDVLESFGLKEALKQTCTSLENRTGMEVTFNHADLEPRYDSAIEVNLFRIAQELLNNVHKHAMGTKVFVSLMDHGESLSLTVEDDGVGFDRSVNPKGIGLRNVRSRVNMINGEIDVESAENSGTLINIEVPKSV